MEAPPPSESKESEKPPSSPVFLPYAGYFEREQFSPVLVSLAALFVLLFLYQIGGAIFTIALAGVESLTAPTGHEGAMRAAQVLSQIVFLAIPTLILVSLHTGRKPFSAISMEFLAWRATPSIHTLLYSSLAIMAMSPFLSYVGDLQLVIMNDVLGWGDAIRPLYAQYKALLERLTLVRTPLEFIAVVGVVVLTPAICEELLFRGYVQRNFQRAMPSRRAVVVVGVLFGLYHLNPAQVIPLILLGVYLSYLRASSGSLLVPIVAHFANNFFSVLGLIAIRHKEQLGISDELAKRLQSDEPDIASPEAIGAMLISLLVTAGLLWLYRRSVAASSP
ncbi:MAG: CPBP family intramembrane metalloprotease [Chloroherpetonaceae bacterium]|nr:CPBP family intramembrane metalloprotease [Chloroherpetonaceae bacterium]